ncbi:Z-DNA-binding protein 1 isoform X3 [Callorhinus ursinus]|uniref:Z-DNA-binding protein 1 isoform X3 n=1 Tax=Callorhinus ursinus TaxID=34884 RepID=A0A3Q7MPS8_CALUR|nr:Z-DNA-binding protein 1 isoform X3 [Callorhinus ursinus]
MTLLAAWPEALHHGKPRFPLLLPDAGAPSPATQGHPATTQPVRSQPRCRRLPHASRLPAPAARMAQAPGDPDERDLEQRILQMLRDTGSPMKAFQLAKECQVPKKKLNQVLYRMKEESKVSLEGQATWGLGKGRAGEVEPTELAQPNQAERPQQGVVAVPQEAGSRLTTQQEDIYRILEAHGPCKALTISQKLGRKTAKEVNPDLYAMRRKHLLDFDEKSSIWAIYQPDLRGRNPATEIICQKTSINIICQNGPNNHISIDKSEAIQIGHGNVIMRQVASGENMAPADPSTQSSPAAAWGPQDIHMEKSVLRQVQMGHGNKMNLIGAQARGPAAWSPLGSPPGSPPVSATAEGPGASFEIRMPQPGSSSKEEVAQRVHIKSCFLEDTAIGNSNRMTVSSETAGPGGVAKPEDGRRDPAEPSKVGGSSL